MGSHGHGILMGLFHLVFSAIIFLLVDTALMGMTFMDNKWYNRYSRIIALFISIIVSYAMHYVYFHM